MLFHFKTTNCHLNLEFTHPWTTPLIPAGFWMSLFLFEVFLCYITDKWQRKSKMAPNKLILIGPQNSAKNAWADIMFIKAIFFFDWVLLTWNYEWWNWHWSLYNIFMHWNFCEVTSCRSTNNSHVPDSLGSRDHNNFHL